ncbi:MAG: hypothetical protein K6B71_00120 [Alphaproteobacteria bacterium]|nr:hypothetical protein [Alphaproteobacteria bacterium]
MKRIAIFLSGLLALPAFAEVAPVYLDDGVIYADAEYYDDADVMDEEVQETSDVNSSKNASKPAVSSRSVSSSRVKASRTVPSGAVTAVSGRASNGAAARAVAARSTNNTSPRANTARTTTNRATTNRTATAGATRATVSRASAAGAATRATGGVAGSSKTRTVSGRGSTSATRARTGTLYTANSAARVSVGDRVMAGNRDTSRVGTNVRVPAIRSGSMTYTAANTNTSSAATATSTTELDELAELTDYCKAQYANCMDNYCNVLDDNQGRCSCSANLKNYSKAETTLKQVTEELQDVAQKIKYIGLNTRDVETLFTQTEAELKMQSTSDNSNIKNSLDKIRNMIVDVQSGSSTGTTSTDVAFDLSGLLDFNIDSTGFDLSAFLGSFSTTSNTSSIKNQRGEQLYKTATARCKANVLNSCVAQGVDAAIITNSYDLEIDKQCIAYERSLNDSNDQMAATVRNAKFVLQNARLLVSRQKNEYSDMRQCVSALDSCMQDDFVCGSEYEKCLDPTGRYIVNGELVVGSQPGQAIDPNVTLDSAADSNVCKVNLYRTWDMPTGDPCSGSNYAPGVNQGNAWGTGSNDTLANYIDATVTDTAAQDGSVNMSKYLQNKIGYVNNNTGLNYGMCVSVLNKCQNYTYTGAGTNAKYNPKNDVIKQYLARVLVQIKAKQDEILNDYAANCVTDVTNCLNTNNYPSGSSAANTANSVQQRVAINACRSTILTCMSVTGYSTENPTPAQLANWVYGILGQVQTTTSSTTNVGYVPSQKMISYHCDDIGATSNNVTPVTVSTNNKWQHKNACQEKSGYRCVYCKPGMTCTTETDDSNQLESPANYTITNREYDREGSSVIEYVCTEQTTTYSTSEPNQLSSIFGNLDDINGINFVDNASVDVGDATNSFVFNPTDIFTLDQNYSCSYSYNNQNVYSGDTVTLVNGQTFSITCTQDYYTVTYNCDSNADAECGLNNTDCETTVRANQAFNPNGCTTPPTGYTCNYFTDSSYSITAGSTVTANADMTLYQQCSPIAYTVNVDCGDNAIQINQNASCEYGQICYELANACEPSDSTLYECTTFTYNGGTYDFTYSWNWTATNPSVVINCTERQITMNYNCYDGSTQTQIFGATSSDFILNDMCSHSNAPQGYTYSYTYDGVSYNAGDQVNRVTNVYDVYSSQTPITYSINWNCGANSTGNSGVSGTEHVNYASHYDLSTKCTANPGYACDWKRSGSHFPANTQYNIAEDINVEYVCEAVTYTVSVSAGTGATCENNAQFNIQYGQVLPVPDNCTVSPGYNNCKYRIASTDYTPGTDTYDIETNATASYFCEPISYQIQYSCRPLLGGAETSQTTQTVTYDSSFVIGSGLTPAQLCPSVFSGVSASDITVRISTDNNPIEYGSTQSLSNYLSTNQTNNPLVTIYVYQQGTLNVIYDSSTIVASCPYSGGIIVFTSDQCDGTYCGGGTNGQDVHCSKSFYANTTLRLQNLLWPQHFSGGVPPECCVFEQQGGSETPVMSLDPYTVTQDTVTLKVYCDSRCQQ